MAEFIDELLTLKHSFSDMNHNMDLINNLGSIGSSDHVRDRDRDRDHAFMSFSSATFLDHQQSSNHPMNFSGDFGHASKTGKTIPGIENLMNGLADHPPVSGTGLSRKCDESLGSKRKRKRKNEDQNEEKPKDVIHVRAKRGQATDSHSLAERVRREKINERLKSLQDLVPGCYKTMGMAVMLDVIINYVQSLQNQIDFLSMKLSAASMYYDLNFLDMDSVEPLQGLNVYDDQAQEMESMPMVREVNGGPLHTTTTTNFNSTWSL